MRQINDPNAQDAELVQVLADQTLARATEMTSTCQSKIRTRFQLQPTVNVAFLGVACIAPVNSVWLFTVNWYVTDLVRHMVAEQRDKTRPRSSAIKVETSKLHHFRMIDSYVDPCIPVRFFVYSKTNCSYSLQITLSGHDGPTKCR